MTIERIPISLIRPNPDNPRQTFPIEHIRQLAASIRAAGLMQPITVRRVQPDEVGTTYEIVAGECRWRAHRLLAETDKRFETIKAQVERLSTKDRDVAAIIENLQRADLNPIEEARAFAAMVAKGWEPEALARAVGCAPFRVRWRLSLMDLDTSIQQLVATGALPPLYALEMAKLSHSDQRRVMAGYTAGKLTTIDAIRSAVATLQDKAAQPDLLPAQAPQASPQDVFTLNQMETRIERMAAMAASGWKDGECIVATRVSPDRTELMADKIKATIQALKIMEKELRRACAARETALI